MSNHTPGPWSMVQFEFLEGEALEVELHRHPDWWEVVSNPDKDYRRMCVSGHIGEANARLISAAPELLEALDIIVCNAVLQPDAAMSGATDCYAVPIDDIEAARAAIAKARGAV